MANTHPSARLDYLSTFVQTGASPASPRRPTITARGAGQSPLLASCDLREPRRPWRLSLQASSGAAQRKAFGGNADDSARRRGPLAVDASAVTSAAANRPATSRSATLIHSSRMESARVLQLDAPLALPATPRMPVQFVVSYVVVSSGLYNLVLEGRKDGAASPVRLQVPMPLGHLTQQPGRSQQDHLQEHEAQAWQQRELYDQSWWNVQDGSHQGSDGGGGGGTHPAGWPIDSMEGSVGEVDGITASHPDTASLPGGAGQESARGIGLPPALAAECSARATHAAAVYVGSRRGVGPISLGSQGQGLGYSAALAGGLGAGEPAPQPGRVAAADITGAVHPLNQDAESAPEDLSSRTQGASRMELKRRGSRHAATDTAAMRLMAAINEAHRLEPIQALPPGRLVLPPSKGAYSTLGLPGASSGVATAVPQGRLGGATNLKPLSTAAPDAPLQTATAVSPDIHVEAPPPAGQAPERALPRGQGSAGLAALPASAPGPVTPGQLPSKALAVAVPDTKRAAPVAAAAAGGEQGGLGSVPRLTRPRNPPASRLLESFNPTTLVRRSQTARISAPRRLETPGVQTLLPFGHRNSNYPQWPQPPQRPVAPAPAPTSVPSSSLSPDEAQQQREQQQQRREQLPHNPPWDASAAHFLQFLRAAGPVSLLGRLEHSTARGSRPASPPAHMDQWPAGSPKGRAAPPKPMPRRPFTPALVVSRAGAKSVRHAHGPTGLQAHGMGAGPAVGLSQSGRWDARWGSMLSKEHTGAPDVGHCRVGSGGVGAADLAAAEGGSGMLPGQPVSTNILQVLLAANPGEVMRRVAKASRGRSRATRRSRAARQPDDPGTASTAQTVAVLAESVAAASGPPLSGLVSDAAAPAASAVTGMAAASAGATARVLAPAAEEAAATAAANALAPKRANEAVADAADGLRATVAPPAGDAVAGAVAALLGAPDVPATTGHASTVAVTSASLEGPKYSRAGSGASTPAEPFTDGPTGQARTLQVESASRLQPSLAAALAAAPSVRELAHILEDHLDGMGPEDIAAACWAVVSHVQAFATAVAPVAPPTEATASATAAPLPCGTLLFKLHLQQPALEFVRRVRAQRGFEAASGSGGPGRSRGGGAERAPWPSEAWGGEADHVPSFALLVAAARRMVGRLARRATEVVVAGGRNRRHVGSGSGAAGAGDQSVPHPGGLARAVADGEAEAEVEAALAVVWAYGHLAEQEDLLELDSALFLDPDLGLDLGLRLRQSVDPVPSPEPSPPRGGPRDAQGKRRRLGRGSGRAAAAQPEGMTPPAGAGPGKRPAGSNGGGAAPATGVAPAALETGSVDMLGPQGDVMEARRMPFQDVMGHLWRVLLATSSAPSESPRHGAGWGREAPRGRGHKVAQRRALWGLWSAAHGAPGLLPAVLVAAVGNDGPWAAQSRTAGSTGERRDPTMVMAAGPAASGGMRRTSAAHAVVGAAAVPGVSGDAVLNTRGESWRGLEGMSPRQLVAVLWGCGRYSQWRRAQCESGTAGRAQRACPWDPASDSTSSWRAVASIAAAALRRLSESLQYGDGTAMTGTAPTAVAPAAAVSREDLLAALAGAAACLPWRSDVEEQVMLLLRALAALPSVRLQDVTAALHLIHSRPPAPPSAPLPRAPQYTPEPPEASAKTQPPRAAGPSAHPRQAPAPLVSSRDAALLDLEAAVLRLLGGVPGPVAMQLLSRPRLRRPGLSRAYLAAVRAGLIGADGALQRSAAQQGPAESRVEVGAGPAWNVVKWRRRRAGRFEHLLPYRLRLRHKIDWLEGGAASAAGMWAYQGGAGAGQHAAGSRGSALPSGGGTGADGDPVGRPLLTSLELQLRNQKNLYDDPAVRCYGTADLISLLRALGAGATVRRNTPTATTATNSALASSSTQQQARAPQPATVRCVLNALALRWLRGGVSHRDLRCLIAVLRRINWLPRACVSVFVTAWRPFVLLAPGALSDAAVAGMAQVMGRFISHSGPRRRGRVGKWGPPRPHAAPAPTLRPTGPLPWPKIRIFWACVTGLASERVRRGGVYLAPPGSDPLRDGRVLWLVAAAPAAEAAATAPAAHGPSMLVSAASTAAQAVAARAGNEAAEDVAMDAVGAAQAARGAAAAARAGTRGPAPLGPRAPATGTGTGTALVAGSARAVPPVSCASLVRLVWSSGQLGARVPQFLGLACCVLLRGLPHMPPAAVGSLARGLAQYRYTDPRMNRGLQVMLQRWLSLRDLGGEAECHWTAACRVAGALLRLRHIGPSAPEIAGLLGQLGQELQLRARPRRRPPRWGPRARGYQPQRGLRAAPGLRAASRPGAASPLNPRALAALLWAMHEEGRAAAGAEGPGAAAGAGAVRGPAPPRGPQTDGLFLFEQQPMLFRNATAYLAGKVSHLSPQALLQVLQVMAYGGSPAHLRCSAFLAAFGTVVQRHPRWLLRSVAETQLVLDCYRRLGWWPAEEVEELVLRRQELSRRVAHDQIHAHYKLSHYERQRKWQQRTAFRKHRGQVDARRLTPHGREPQGLE